MSYRDKFRPIIASVILAHRGEPLSVVRAALRAAFPMGPRMNHPYKIWLDEAAYQLGTKKEKATAKADDSGDGGKLF